MCSRNSLSNKLKLVALINGKICMAQRTCLVGIAILLGLLILTACSAPVVDQAAQNAAASNITTPPASSTPAKSTTPATPSKPAVQATPAQASTPIVTVTPPAAEIPTVEPPPKEELIRTEACQLTLTQADIGQGWLKGNAVPPSRGEVISACSVHYYKGTSFSPVLQNTVAVYRSVDYASRAFAKEEAKQSEVTHPAFGDECFLNDSVLINKLLVFRKENVVVWIWLQQDKKGEIEPYAKILEPRIVQ